MRRNLSGESSVVLWPVRIWLPPTAVISSVWPLSLVFEKISMKFWRVQTAALQFLTPEAKTNRYQSCRQVESFPQEPKFFHRARKTEVVTTKDCTLPHQTHGDQDFTNNRKTKWKWQTWIHQQWELTVTARKREHTAQTIIWWKARRLTWHFQSGKWPKLARPEQPDSAYMFSTPTQPRQRERVRETERYMTSSHHMLIVYAPLNVSAKLIVQSQALAMYTLNAAITAVFL